ncbi:MAG: M56 family metallopeptidase [Lachnospiraceae bacterium]|nr:M56 family metallopeptidase [Lachnospiraceae bacterium]
MTALFLTLLKLSLSASIVLAAVILLRFFLKKIKAPGVLIVSLWALVALRLLVPALPKSTVSMVPQAVGSGQTVERLAERPVEMVQTVREAEPAYSEIRRQNPQLPVQKDEAGDHYVVVSRETQAAPRTVGTDLMPHLARIWAAGAVLMLGYMIGSFLRIRRQIKDARLREKKVYRSENVGSPFILGLIRPRIYLPAALSPADEQYVLAHEKAHLKRGDHIWKPLGFLLLTVYWFNPLFWLGYVLLCRDIETACDEKVVKEENAEYRKAYSFALVNCSMPRHVISACPLAFGETNVRTRIRSVLSYKKPAFWLIVSALVISLVAAGCALTDRKESAADPSETAKEGTATAEPETKSEAEPSESTEPSAEPTQVSYEAVSPYDYLSDEFPRTLPEGNKITREEYYAAVEEGTTDIRLVCTAVDTDWDTLSYYRFSLSADSTENPQPERIRAAVNGIFTNTAAFCSRIPRLDEFAYVYEAIARRPYRDVVPSDLINDTNHSLLAWFYLEKPDGEEDIFALRSDGYLLHFTGASPNDEPSWGEDGWDSITAEPLPEEAWMHLLAIAIRNMESGPPLTLYAPEALSEPRENYWQAKVESDGEKFILSGEDILPLLQLFDDPEINWQRSTEWMTEFDKDELTEGALRITVINAKKESFEEASPIQSFYLTPDGRTLRFRDSLSISPFGINDYISARADFAIRSRETKWAGVYEALKDRDGSGSRQEAALTRIPLEGAERSSGGTQEEPYARLSIPVVVDGKPLYTEEDGICDFCFIPGNTVIDGTLVLLDHLNRRLVWQTEDSSLHTLDLSFCKDPQRIAADQNAVILLDSEGVYFFPLQEEAPETAFAALPDGIRAEQILDVLIYACHADIGIGVLLTTDPSLPYNLVVPYSGGKPGRSVFEPAQEGYQSRLSDYGKWEIVNGTDLWLTNYQGLTGDILSVSSSQRNLAVCVKKETEAFLRFWVDYRDGSTYAVSLRESRIDLSDFVWVPQRLARNNAAGWGSAWVIAPKEDGLYLYDIDIGMDSLGKHVTLSF